ncbi:beta-glucoside-specific PTS transporter subunit IIABC [Musicola paradisiaca]|uniref:PTS system, beta-glucoside-specific IIABC subunit n=1 Tax=Musicola paradisiaca (strain Ech703) TaxID=579405 RepID=C6CA99_MUSP7|nr:beta-glucoside-specific PTS transporter subunit IIABC [Musicola paradisiaca]ACS84574.1 PTS system, beta-glucoside-specific IIABC subunit [Musicola paradisiaca Ech703]
MSTNYQETAKNIVALIGGAENIQQVFHCITRLRFYVHDNRQINRDGLEALDGVIGINVAGEQFQVIIGNEVADVYRALVQQFPLLARQAPEKSAAGTSRHPVSALLEAFSSIFSPIIPAIAGAGILKGILSLLIALKWVSATNQTYLILSAISDGIFYFMPLVLAFSAAHKFGCNPYVAVALAATLLHPTLMKLFQGGGEIAFLGLPVSPVSYASSVIPILLAVWLMSWVERGVDRIMPGALKTMFVPLFTLLIVAPVMLIAIGPLGILVGNHLSTGIVWLVDNMGIVAGLVLGGTLSMIIITGMHYVLIPIMINNISKMGFDPFKIIFYVANMGQAGAAFGVFLRARDKKTKSLALSTSLTATMGITEPAMYGINIRFKRPFAAALIGGACGGSFAMFFGVKTYAFALSGLPGLPALVGPTFLYALASMAISFTTAAVVTCVLGFEEKTAATAATSVGQSVAPAAPVVLGNHNEQLFAPVAGRVMSLRELSDPVFSEEIFGKGIAIYPENGELLSPVNGRLESVFDTNHALTLKSDTGAEVLIHIGIDTVKLGGRHFVRHAQPGQMVEVGEPLVSFDLDALREEGIDPSVIVIVTNTECYGEVLPLLQGAVHPREAFMTLTAAAA